MSDSTTPHPKIDVLLPAGGRISGAFAAEASVEIKTLIAFNGETILERTINRLRTTGRIGHIVVIGPDELRQHPATRQADAVLPEGASGPDNIFRGLEWLREHEREQHRVLVLTTDLAFLSAEALSGFLDACVPDVDVCLPIIRREAFEARFPGSGGFYVRLREGEWTLGCAFLFDPVAVTRNRIHIERIFEAPKSQLAMARLLGPLFIARFLCKRLTVGHIQQRCEQVLGCSGQAVVGCAPELAFDIDAVEEYRYALAHSERNPA